jgi:hypothetical protein
MHADPRLISWQLEIQAIKLTRKVPIWRILKAVGTIAPQPRKRLRMRYVRFKAGQPNQTKQSDFTHGPLVDETSG